MHQFLLYLDMVHMLYHHFVQHTHLVLLMLDQDIEYKVRMNLNHDQENNHRWKICCMHFERDIYQTNGYQMWFDDSLVMVLLDAIDEFQNNLRQLDKIYMTKSYNFLCHQDIEYLIHNHQD